MKKILIFLAVITSMIFSNFAFAETVTEGKQCCPVTPTDFLEGKEFQLMNKFESLKITIGFEKGGVYGFSGVNRYMGGYKISGNKVEFGNMGATMMAGPENAMNAETEYMKMLSNAKQYELKQDGSLVIGDLVFKAIKK